MRKALLDFAISLAGLALVSCGSTSPNSSGQGGSGNAAGGSKAASGGSTNGSGGAANGGASGGAVASGGATSANGGSSPNGGSSSGGAAANGGSASGGRTGDGAGGNSTASGGNSTASGGNSTASGGSSGAAGSANGGSGGGGACTVPTTAPNQPVITFNDDGGWCWYQDERVIVDTVANKMLIGSVATGSAHGNGEIEVSIYDLAAGGTPQRSQLGKLNPDDHNAPALLKLGDGKYVAMYTTHNDDCFTYYNLYSGGKWGTQNKFDWTSLGCPTPNSKTVSYSNVWPMGGKYYDIVRSVETSPNLLVSTDGSSWTYSGRLTSTPRVGYVAGYYKYWGNGSDRVDFIGTEAHPRDEDNSLYHGYIKDGKTYTSKGVEVDDVTDKTAPEITKFTKVFATGTTINGVKLFHMWDHDVVRYDDGTIVMLGQGRVDDGKIAAGTADADMDPDKRLIYARFDGTDWKTTYLVKAGPKLYSSEADYTGLGAVHPTDPHTIYISTTFDPRDDKTTTPKHEIWRGTTCDNGATFKWTQITSNSTKDNLRPVVPYWPGDKTALLWERGDYNSAQTYSTQIIGLILDGR